MKVQKGLGFVYSVHENFLFYFQKGLKKAITGP